MRSGLIKPPRRSISLRIAFFFCLTFTVGIGTAFLAAYLKLSYSLERSSREVLVAKHSEVAAIVSSRGIQGLKDFLHDEKTHILNAPYLFRIVANNGDTLYLKPSVQEEAFDFEGAFRRHSNPEELLGWQTLPALNDEDQFDLYTQKIGSDMYLQIGTSSEDRQEVLIQIASIFAVIGVVFIILSCGLGWWYAQRSLKPIRSLLSTITTIEKGHLGERVHVEESGDELNQLSETFNRMIERLEKMVVIMRESLDNVAHEIRTPLTRIRVVAEDALISQKPAALQEALADCAESVTVISDMVHQLMSISEAESGTLAIHCESANIQEMLKDVIDIYDFVAQEKAIEVVCLSTDENLRWVIDRKRIKQAIANLLDNALKFSPPKTRVEISAMTVGAQLQISVSDQGPGIPPGDIDRIWDRLYRGDKSRTTKGAGLGLSIARAVVFAHGGTITVNSQIGEGTTFTILLPEPRIT